MLLAVFLLNVVHPGTVLRGPESEFPRLSRKAKKALKLEKKERKRAAKEEKKQLKMEKKAGVGVYPASQPVSDFDVSSSEHGGTRNGQWETV